MSNKMVLVLLSFAFAAGCGTHQSPDPITSPPSAPTPTVCAPGNVSYSKLNYNSLVAGTGYLVINSQTDYAANYYGYGDPTPTPVPVDFSKKTLICVYSSCQCSETAALLGITTDCSSVTVNIQYVNQPACFQVICDSIYTQVYNLLIDKTNMPVNVNYTYAPCPTATTGP